MLEETVAEKIDYSALALTEDEIELMSEEGSGDADLSVDDDLDTYLDDDSDTKDTIYSEPSDKEAGVQEVAEAAQTKEFVPEYNPAIASNDLSEQYKALSEQYESKTADLDTRYEEGDLSFAEYSKLTREASSEYYNQKSELDVLKIKSSIAEEQKQQFSEQKWQWEQDRFFSTAGNEELKKDTVLFAALSAALQGLYKDQAFDNKSGAELLDEAARQVRSRFGKNSAETPDKIKKSSKIINMPKTLANLPVAESADERDSEFDYLDKLSGLDAERALARMSEEQRELYLRA